MIPLLGAVSLLVSAIERLMTAIAHAIDAAPRPIKLLLGSGLVIVGTIGGAVLFAKLAAFVAAHLFAIGVLFIGVGTFLAACAASYAILRGDWE